MAHMDYHFKIGEFSRISQVSIRSLRHYDKIGLFKPEYTDRFTGYRYYSIDQLPRLNRILALKSLGLSLEQVMQLMDENLSVEEMRALLEQKTQEIRQYIQQEQARLTRLEQRLAYVAESGSMPEYDIVLKQVGPRRVMSLREHITNLDNIVPLFYTIAQVLRDQRIPLTGKPSLCVYLDVEIPGISAEVELAVPVESVRVERVALPNGRDLTPHDLPGHPTVATTLHQGGYSSRLASHIAAARWMAHNGYQLAGPVREVFHRTYGPGQDSDNVIEIQFPIVRREHETPVDWGV